MFTLLFFFSNVQIKNPLVSSDFGHYSLQTGTMIKLYIVINTDIDQYGGKKNHELYFLAYHQALI